MSQEPPPEQPIPNPDFRPEPLPAPALPVPAPLPPLPEPALPKPPEQPRDQKHPLYWVWYLNPWKWPWWAKILAGIILIPILTFYFRDLRVGDGFWGKKPVDVEHGVKILVDSYGRVKVHYKSGKILPADGLSMVIVTEEDNEKAPERLAAFKTFISSGDYPLVIFLNATGFDPTGEPICIRKAEDGTEVYRAVGKDANIRVALSIPRRDGNFVVYHLDGTSVVLSEKDWVTKYLRLDFATQPDPKDLEKLSDEELKKRGYERIPIEEAKKRGLIDEKGNIIPPRRLTIHELMKDKEADKGKDKSPEKKEKDKK